MVVHCLSPNQQITRMNAATHLVRMEQRVITDIMTTSVCAPVALPERTAIQRPTVDQSVHHFTAQSLVPVTTQEAQSHLLVTLVIPCGDLRPERAREEDGLGPTQDVRIRMSVPIILVTSFAQTLTVDTSAIVIKDMSFKEIPTVLILTNAQLRTEAVPTLVTTLLVHSHVPVQPGSHWILVKEAVRMSTSVLLTMVAVNILASTHTSPSPVFADRDTLWAGIKRPAKQFHVPV